MPAHGAHEGSVWGDFGLREKRFQSSKKKSEMELDLEIDLHGKLESVNRVINF